MTDPSHDPRSEPHPALPEREMLETFLDYHRDTLKLKVAGLTQSELSRTTAASSLTLAGLLKHLALVEDSWFTERFAGQPMPPPFDVVDWDADPDWEHRTAVDDDPAWLVQRYDEACARSRAVAAAAASLDQEAAAGRRREDDAPFTLRWILCHMIEETARHNGHADLLREAIDGTTGE
ncbi:MAG: DinB family protein [Acidimicrobiales bacterium]